MKKDYRVVLTEEDVCNATAGDFHNCMWKRAIQRTVPEASRIKVTGREIALSVTVQDTRYRFATPKAAHESLKEFDRVGPEGARRFIGSSFWLHFDEAVAEPMYHHSQKSKDKMREAYNDWAERQAIMSPEERATIRAARVRKMATARKK